MKTPYTCKQNLPLADRSEMESIKRESQSYFWLSILICVISFILLIVYVADSVVDRSYTRSKPLVFSLELVCCLRHYAVGGRIILMQHNIHVKTKER